MTAKQAKKLKRGDRVIHKRRGCMEKKQYETTVEYVSYNPIARQYFIATMDGWGGYHKDMEVVTNA